MSNDRMAGLVQRAKERAQSRHHPLRQKAAEWLVRAEKLEREADVLGELGDFVEQAGRLQASIELARCAAELTGLVGEGPVVVRPPMAELH